MVPTAIVPITSSATWPERFSGGRAGGVRRFGHHVPGLFEHVGIALNEVHLRVRTGRQHRLPRGFAAFGIATDERDAANARLRELHGAGEADT